MEGGRRKNKKREIRKKENECGPKRDQREWDRQFVKERETKYEKEKERIKLIREKERAIKIRDYCKEKDI